MASEHQEHSCYIHYFFLLLKFLIFLSFLLVILGILVNSTTLLPRDTTDPTKKTLLSIYDFFNARVCGGTVPTTTSVTTDAGATDAGAQQSRRFR